MSNGLASQLLSDLTAELLSRGTRVRFRPSGRSMYPSIREGELITVEPVDPTDVKRGDIILYRSERGVIAHRVVGKFSSPTQSSVLSPHHSFLLRGDTSSSCDEPVTAHQILGRVVFVERNGRSIQLASRGAKMWHKARRWASRLRRAISRQLSAVSSQEEQRPPFWIPRRRAAQGFYRVFALSPSTGSEARVRSKTEAHMEKM